MSPRPSQSAFVSLLDLHYIDGRRWQLRTRLIYHSHIAGRLVVPAGSYTDFASIPRGLWSLFPKDDYAQAAVIHDWAYQTKALTRATADAVFKEGLAVLGAPRWKQWVLYLAVRAFGWVAYTQG